MRVRPSPITLPHPTLTQVAARVPRAAIRVVSNIHVLEPTPLGFWQRSGAVFTGNFNHLPNRDAILFFAQAVLPLVHPKVSPSEERGP